jgi:serine/threonine protein kinase
MEDLKYASIDTLLGTASEVVADIADSSNVFNPVIEEKMPRFHHKEVSFGHILGRGGFCIVREVDKIRPYGKSVGTSTKSLKKRSRCGFIFRITKKRMDEERDHPDSFDLVDNSESPTRDDLKFSRDFIASRSKKSRIRGGGRYVVKTVSTDLDKLTYMKGHVDMALEAKFLSALDHPNIIELAAVSTTDSCHPDFFLILERMSETLNKKIKSWMDRDRLNQGVGGIFTGGKKKVEKLYRERIGASHDIASGLYYLHSKNIIYRDLVSIVSSNPADVIGKFIF